MFVPDAPLDNPADTGLRTLPSHPHSFDPMSSFTIAGAWHEKTLLSYLVLS